MQKNELRDAISGAIRRGCNVKLLGDSLTAGSGSSDSDLSGRVIYPPFRRQRGRRCWASLLRDHLAGKYSCSVDSVGCYGITSGEMMAPTTKNSLTAWSSWQKIWTTCARKSPQTAICSFS